MHPLAHAVVTAAKERGLEAGAVEDFASQTGLGVSATVGGRGVVIGNAAQLTRIAADPRALEAAAAPHRATGAGVMFVAIDGKAAGFLVVSDPVRSM